MENKNKPNIFQPINSVRLGCIELQSNTAKVEDLCGLILQMLEEKNVKKYLDILKKKEMLHSNMTG